MNTHHNWQHYFSYLLFSTLTEYIKRKAFFPLKLILGAEYFFFFFCTFKQLKSRTSVVVNLVVIVLVYNLYTNVTKVKGIYMDYMFKQVRQTI